MASGKKSSRKTKQAKRTDEENFFVREVLLWIVIAVSILLFISNFGVGGIVGNAVSNFFFGVFGLIAYIFPILLLLGTFFSVSNKGNDVAVFKIIAALVFVLFLCCFISLLYGGDSASGALDAFRAGFYDKTGGGFFGGFLAWALSSAFGTIGAYVIDVIALIITLVLITGRSAIKGVRSGGHKVYETAVAGNERYRELAETRANNRRLDKKTRGVAMDTKIVPEPEITGSSDEMSELYPSDAVSDVTGAASPDVSSQRQIVINSSDDIYNVADEYEEQESPAAVPPSPKKAKVHIAKDTDTAVDDTDVAVDINPTENPLNRPYIRPTTALLSKPSKKSGDSRQHLQETAIKLQQTLKNFGVNVTVTNISCGPAVTRYEILPEMGVKVSKIVNLADDIKLNLAAADIRIEAPIPGKAAIGIEVPNKENVTVSFRELIESDEFKNASSNISFCVGKDIAGKVKVADIAKMPHLLIAGATGSGKSVCINTIIMSILYKADPNDVKLIMIDPKVVELSVYNGIPHLLIPVVTDPKKAAGALHWAVDEMTERYNKFAEAGVRDLKGYNAKVDSLPEIEGQQKPERLPQIVIIVDELADLMMVASNEVEEAICRLAQLARACGIHLIIATQRPSVNVITGLIKANMPSRIAFAVTSGVDSRTILDMVGAEKLLGKGDMLFNPQGESKPIRVQGAFVSDKEVSDVVRFIKDKNSAAAYSTDIEEKMKNAESANNTVAIDGADRGGDGRDAYFMDAAKLIIDKEKASIGMIQRFFKVGFNRAARIMDQLEEAGIVGPEEGTKPRRILMTPEQLEQFEEEQG